MADPGSAAMLLAPSRVSAQGDPALERARIQLESGKVYFERGDYRRAIEQFHLLRDKPRNRGAIAVRY